MAGLPGFDVDAVRARFSALDGSFAFFDAPGGTQVPDEVGDAIARAMREASGNVGAVYPAPSSPVGTRFETGSMPIETLAGFSATLRYLDSIGGLEAIAAWEAELGERFLAGLPAQTVRYGLAGTKDRVPILLLNLPGVRPDEAVIRLAEQDIGVWSGTNFYSLGLYERLSWGEALRVGIGHYNTLDEVDKLTAALSELAAGTGR